MRAVLQAVLGLAPAPAGFSAGELALRCRQVGGTALATYDSRRAAYDLAKLRGKDLVTRIEHSHRYALVEAAAPIIAALVLLRERVLRPLLAAAATPITAPIRLRRRQRRAYWQQINDGYSRLRREMRRLFDELHILPPKPQNFGDPLCARG